MKNRSQRNNIIDLSLDNGQKYTKYNMYLSIMMVIWIKQHLSNFRSSIHEKVKGALSALRQFLAVESPLKLMKKAFYFTSNALFVLKIFKFLS